MIREKDNLDPFVDGTYVDDNSLVMFFRAFTGKFWKLMSANVVFLLLNIPALILSYFLCNYVVDLLPISTDESGLMLLLVLVFPVMIFFLAVPVITVGPAQAGLTYVLKSYCYGIPIFFWYDFKQKAKENFRQSLIVSLINFVAIAFLLIDLYLYKNIAVALDQSFMPFAYAVILIVLILILMMTMYIYPMMVSYELSIKNIYKNAFLLSLGHFLPNLMILIILFVLMLGPMLIVIATESYLALSLVYVYYMLLGFALPGLVINSYINPIVDKHLRADEKNSGTDMVSNAKSDIDDNSN